MRASGRFPVAVDAPDDGDAHSHKGKASVLSFAQNPDAIPNSRETNKERQNRHCGPYGAQ